MTMTPERTGARTSAPVPVPERRRSTRLLQVEDAYAVGGSLLAGVALSWVISTRLAPFDGLLGFVVLAWLCFLGCYLLVLRVDQPGPVIRDRFAAVVVQSLAALVLLALVSVVVFTVAKGRGALSHLNFFTEDLTAAGPLDGLDKGGVQHAVIGSLEQIGLALLLTVPIGLACALFLTEVPGRLSRLVRTISEAMTALPSIVAGLFIYATFVLALGRGKSGLAASLAISVMMLPIIIRSADVVLRTVPGNLKEASLALGAGQWRTVWNVTLPTARSGLATAVILGTARGIGETSPVLLTAGFASNRNLNPFEGPQISLPLEVFTLVQFPEATQRARAFGAAVVLLVLVLVLFVLARIIGGRGPGDLTRRQARKATRASRADLERISSGSSARPVTPSPKAEP